MGEYIITKVTKEQPFVGSPWYKLTLGLEANKALTVGRIMVHRDFLRKIHHHSEDHSHTKEKELTDIHVKINDAEKLYKHKVSELKQNNSKKKDKIKFDTEKKDLKYQYKNGIKGLRDRYRELNKDIENHIHYNHLIGEKIRIHIG